MSESIEKTVICSHCGKFIPSDKLIIWEEEDTKCFFIKKTACPFCGWEIGWKPSVHDVALSRT